MEALVEGLLVHRESVNVGLLVTFLGHPEAGALALDALAR